MSHSLLEYGLLKFRPAHVQQLIFLAISLPIRSLEQFDRTDVSSVISADRLRCSPLEDQTLAAIPENRPLVRFAFAPDTPAVRQHHASPSNEVQERRGWDSSSYQENIVSRSAVSTGEEAKEDAVIEMNRLHDEKTVSTEERDTTGEEASRCPICLEEYEDGEERSFWPECAHEFHRNCIDRHRLVCITQRNRHPSCPLCARGDTGFNEELFSLQPHPAVMDSPPLAVSVLAPSLPDNRMACIRAAWTCISATWWISLVFVEGVMAVLGLLVIIYFFMMRRG